MTMRAPQELTPRYGTHPGIPASLPALLYADKVIDRAQRAGAPLAADGDTMGERLLALALEAHAAGLDLEQELRRAVRSRVEEPRGSGPE